jgi:DNA-directed RNA polymerase subunit RPC12/RpoP
MKTKNIDENSRYDQWMSEYALIKFQKGGRRHAENQGFRCGHCRQEVHAGSMWTHVQNRNHCPYCLWSRHLDLKKTGDRLCACKGWMKPVGLTIKRTIKKYARSQFGELMLVHQCQDCNRISINRLAADDMTDRLWEVFENSCRPESPLENILQKDGVRLLQSEEAAFARTLVFGRGLDEHFNEKEGRMAELMFA